MEGPTPASALIHAATMVAAGTYVLARLFALLVASDTARLVLAVITALTMVGAALLAFGQSDLKRLLAYSTISQIAIMLSALAVVPARLGPDAGILHLLSHAMFKALLFLALGWLSVLVGGTAALTARGGARLHQKVAVPLGIGLLSLAGVPPLVGFVSKEFVLAAAEDGTRDAASPGARLVLVALFATVALTAAYCMRAWLILTRLTPEEEEEIDALEEAVERASWESDVSLAEMFGPVLHPAQEPPATRPAGLPAAARPRRDLRGRPSRGVAAGGAHGGRRGRRAVPDAAPRTVLLAVVRGCLAGPHRRRGARRPPAHPAAAPATPPSASARAPSRRSIAAWGGWRLPAPGRPPRDGARAAGRRARP
jgi:hypothetical protein